MGDAAKLLIGGPSEVYVVGFGLFCVGAQIFLQYARYVQILKWLTLTLFAYVAALAVVNVPWREALLGVFIPSITWSSDFFTTLVAIAGTTISPYLFFWQAAQEAEDVRVEPEREPLRWPVGRRRRHSHASARTQRWVWDSPTSSPLQS